MLENNLFGQFIEHLDYHASPLVRYLDCLGFKSFAKSDQGGSLRLLLKRTKQKIFLKSQRIFGNGKSINTL